MADSVRMNNRIYLSPPHMGGGELELIQEAFKTNWVAPAGPHIEDFENEIAAYLNMKGCAVLSSGTAAIHLALIILGVQRGDEVICSSLTFSGSCNPIVYLGAVPVFVDSENQTWNMDPELLEAAVLDRIKKGKKPKAIIVVHLYGMPAKINEIMRIAAVHDIPVIEDAAEGLGSAYRGRKLGTFGDIAIFSFNGNKIITTSGGGAMVSNRKEWIQKAKFLSAQARDPAPHYQHSEIGYNYRLSNICAGIGRGQLRVLDERVAQRRTVFSFYKKQLDALPGVSFQPEPEDCHSNRWLTCLLLDPSVGLSSTPEDIRTALESKNIESRPLWKPMHLQPVFKAAPFYGSFVSERLFVNGLCLPSGSNLKIDELQTISEIVHEKLVQK